MKVQIFFSLADARRKEHRRTQIACRLGQASLRRMEVARSGCACGLRCVGTFCGALASGHCRGKFIEPLELALIVQFSPHTLVLVRELHSKIRMVGIYRDVALNLRKRTGLVACPIRCSVQPQAIFPCGFPRPRMALFCKFRSVNPIAFPRLLIPVGFSVADPSDIGPGGLGDADVHVDNRGDRDIIAGALCL